ncbi:MAG: response regulator transcription factor [Chloroflexi bacterium]|nr:response regulator transcription factor [Chloroflexota bacterium]
MPLRTDESPISTECLTRVLIVDDHLAFSGAVEIAINAQGDMISVGAAASVAAALAAVRRESPDVVLMDVHLPDGDGIDATKQIVELGMGTRVLILTAHTSVDVMARAASAGACGFLPKESSVGSVLRAIRAAGDGQMVVDGSTLAAILGRLQRPATALPDPLPGAPSLTRREHDVLALMGEGLDPHAIAQKLGISLNSCRGYQKNILAKLGAHSQLEAVVVASRRGLIGPDMARRVGLSAAGQRG